MREILLRVTLPLLEPATWRRRCRFLATRVLGPLALYSGAAALLYLVLLNGADDRETWTTIGTLLFAAGAFLIGVCDCCDDGSERAPHPPRSR